MELRHLRYVVAVADEGSITRAAERLGMEQPPLSHQIGQFERELGCRLFQRHARGVRLTEGGEALIQQARDILALQQEFLATAAGIGRGERGRIRIGLAGAVSFLPVVAHTIRRFGEAYPDITMLLEDSNTPALNSALHDGSVDVAVVRPPLPDEHHLLVQKLFDEPTVVALPAGHEHAGAGPVNLAALAREKFILFRRELGPGFHDAILAACLEAGFTPRMGQQAPQIVSTVPLVAAGLGVSVVPQSLRQINVPGVIFRALAEPAPTARLAVAIRRERRPPYLTRFVDALLASCRSPPRS